MFVGYHVINVLKEFRQTLKKTNEVLENVHTVTDTVSNPVSSVINLVTGITKGFRAAKSITTLSDLDKPGKDKREEKKG